MLLEPALVEWSPLGSIQAAHSIRISLAEIKDRGARLKAIADICRRIGADLGQYSSVDRGSRDSLQEQLAQSLAPDYELSKEIDAGDFSFVYAGIRTADRRPVAVKAIVTSSVQTWAIERLQNQVQKARLLTDPTFIRIHEAVVSTDDARARLSRLERLPGRTLQDLRHAAGMVLNAGKSGDPAGGLRRPCSGPPTGRRASTRRCANTFGAGRGMLQAVPRGLPISGVFQERRGTFPPPRAPDAHSTRNQTTAVPCP